MSDLANTLSDLAKVCGNSEYQLAQYCGLDPTFVRRLFDGEKRESNFTTIRLTIALVMDPGLIRRLDMHGSPVIVEYKHAVSGNLVNHGLFYLDWLHDNRTEYRLLVEVRLGSEAAATIDWTDPRLNRIAASFSRYDSRAIRQIKRSIMHATTGLAPIFSCSSRWNFTLP